MHFNHNYHGWKLRGNRLSNCTRCGCEYMKDAPRQKRCIPCQGDWRREYKREWYRKQKEESENG